MENDKAQNVLSRGSEYYCGSAGTKYFEWQNRNGAIGGKIEARKFRSYIKSMDCVLDFGCGAGHILHNLECARRVGVEINPVARAVAVKAGIECHDSIASIDDNFFDAVISNHALEHVEFPVAALRALRRKLKPSGFLILCVPIDDWRTQLHFDPDDVNHHLQTWTPQLLGNSLTEAGFLPSDFSIRLLNHAWFPGAPKVYGRLPDSLFDVLCNLFAVIARRRQLFAVAKKGSGS